MAKSMTGYGRAENSVDGFNITVEIKSVNSRFLEFAPRTPKTYGFLEDRLRKYVSTFISRGKVECSVFIDSTEADDNVTVEVNKSLAKGYIDAINLIAREYGLENDFKISDLAMKTDIFTVRKAPADEEKIWNEVKSVFDEAMASFIGMRAAEGEKLKEDILRKADFILSLVEKVEQRSPVTVEEYRQKLTDRIKEMLADTKIDEQRILTEAAIFADKVAVDEETVRLRSHISQLKNLFEQDVPIGRKLDFLVQEMNREANTIGSKCTDLEISEYVIEIKSEIEKIREQIQNIE